MSRDILVEGLVDEGAGQLQIYSNLRGQVDVVLTDEASEDVKDYTCGSQLYIGLHGAEHLQQLQDGWKSHLGKVNLVCEGGVVGGMVPYCQKIVLWHLGVPQ